MSVTTIYLSGKITGLDPKDVEKKFKTDEIRLKKMYYDVINPAHLSKIMPPETPWSDYMRKCIPLLLQADEIYMQADWIASKGARLEHRIAKALNIPVTYEEKKHEALFGVKSINR